jgi:hypothetical protein
MVKRRAFKLRPKQPKKPEVNDQPTPSFKQVFGYKSGNVNGVDVKHYLSDTEYCGRYYHTKVYCSDPKFIIDHIEEIFQDVFRSSKAFTLKQYEYNPDTIGTLRSLEGIVVSGINQYIIDGYISDDGYSLNYQEISREHDL